MTDDALRRRARDLDVQIEYHDVHGQGHEADPAALAVVVEMLEADRVGEPVFEPVVVARAGPDGVHALGTATSRVTDLELVLVDGTVLSPRVQADGHTIVVDGPVPFGCHTLQVETMAGGTTCTFVHPPPSMAPAPGRLGGASLFVPTYALWDHDHPLPSFGLLGQLARAVGALGVDVLTTLPLFATFLDDPFEPGPYSPASRLHWNEAFLDDDALPSAPVPALGRHLDWATVGRRRRDQLRRAAAELDEHGETELDTFLRRRPDVVDFARFLTRRIGDGDDSAGGPPALEQRSHELAQMLADRQLAALARAAHDEGAAGLAIDLPIGGHPAGFERWAYPELFAEGFDIGAPPDMFFTEGQNWGLPPQLPGAGRRSGYRLWRDLLTRAGEHAALVRIDHVMAVHRLWWVPDGFSAAHGVYVRYPRHELLAVIAATAAANDTVVVGEDLGTVPAEVAEALAEWGMLGMHEEQFHMVPPMLPHDGLAEIAARTVAGIRTHDMQPFAAFVEEQGPALTDYRRRLADSLGREVGDAYWSLLDAVLEHLVGSRSALVTIDLDDLTGEQEHHNVPGQVLATNWCRRLDHPISTLIADPDLRRRLTLLGSRPRV